MVAETLLTLHPSVAILAMNPFLDGAVWHGAALADIFTLVLVPVCIGLLTLLTEVFSSKECRSRCDHIVMIIMIEQT